MLLPYAATEPHGHNVHINLLNFNHFAYPEDNNLNIPPSSEPWV
jgi:hypothetical protein